MIFKKDIDLEINLEDLFSEKEKKISNDFIAYEDFKKNLFSNESFLVKNSKNKIFLNMIGMK